MLNHQFIFTPGRWVGSGKISFSASPEHIRFHTSWVIEEANDMGIKALQHVEMIGADQVVNNHVRIYDAKANKFKIELENELFGMVFGTGIVDEKTIAWEFHSASGNTVEGFEVYELQENGDYMLHAEYSSQDLFRTIIEGRIWKK
jgi:hypothetical protein